METLGNIFEKFHQRKFEECAQSLVGLAILFEYFVIKEKEKLLSEVPLLSKNRQKYEKVFVLLQELMSSKLMRIPLENV